jgi:hypothetical protein
MEQNGRWRGTKVKTQKQSYAFSLKYVTCSEKSQPRVVEDLWVSLEQNKKRNK